MTYELDYTKMTMSDLCDLADAMDEREYARLLNEEEYDPNWNKTEAEQRQDLINLIEDCKPYFGNYSYRIKDEWIKNLNKTRRGGWLFLAYENKKAYEEGRPFEAKPFNDFNELKKFSAGHAKSYSACIGYVSDYINLKERNKK
jgi:hypothetical protein